MMATCFECQPSLVGLTTTVPAVPPNCEKCGKPCIGGHWVHDPNEHPRTLLVPDVPGWWITHRAGEDPQCELVEPHTDGELWALGARVKDIAPGREWYGPLPLPEGWKL